MLSRPFDETGDALPVLKVSDLLSGPEAAAAALRDHLNLFPGDWWEDPEQGNEIFDLIASSRCTEKEAGSLASWLCSYIQDFPGIRSLSEVQASAAGGIFSFSCTAHTEQGEAVAVSFSAP